MKLLIRKALANSSRARSDEDYASVTARVDGIEIGQKYTRRSFVRLVVFAGTQIREFLDAEQMNAAVPGLGTLSPMSVTFDSVSVGDSAYAHHETFQSGTHFAATKERFLISTGRPTPAGPDVPERPKATTGAGGVPEPAAPPQHRGAAVAAQQP
eukprot:Skav236502  [mRNA]  locus=scaffold78:178232:178871:- [translate_table: standard]